MFSILGCLLPDKPDSALLLSSGSLWLFDSIGFTRSVYHTYDVLAKAIQHKTTLKHQAQQYLSYKTASTGKEQQGWWPEV